MHRWREDWEGMAKPCDGQVDWEQRQVNSEWRTDARSSFITRWEIQPAGKITLKAIFSWFNLASGSPGAHQMNLFLSISS